MSFTYIDLFAGAGGLSEGFLINGFTPVAHVEMKKEACLTLKTRSCFYYLKDHGMINDYYRYLKGEISREELYAMVPEGLLRTVLNQTMSESSLPTLFDSIDALKSEQNISEIDVLVGGPPCQAYSLVGRARSKTKMQGDPRNYLYMLYCRVLEKYRPKMFVFENVPGLLTANHGKYFEDMQARFRAAGYQLDYRVLNSNTFGVLQNRKRVILIGWRLNKQYSYPAMEEIDTAFCVRDLLSDLPPLQPGDSCNTYIKPATSYLKWSNIREENDVLTQHQARMNQERDREIYRYVISAWQNGHNRPKYTDLPEELCTHRNRTAFLDRFKVVADDMPYSQTMVAHISKDGHYYIHPDLQQARSLTVREAARIQSFPDNYFFEGGRTAAYLQIGNAVPPLMAAAIAKSLKEQLQEK